MQNHRGCRRGIVCCCSPLDRRSMPRGRRINFRRMGGSVLPFLSCSSSSRTNAGGGSDRSSVPGEGPSFQRDLSSRAQLAVAGHYDWKSCTANAESEMNSAMQFCFLFFAVAGRFVRLASIGSHLRRPSVELCLLSR